MANFIHWLLLPAFLTLALGLWRRDLDPARRRLLILSLVVAGLVLTLFFVNGRFRLPLLALLMARLDDGIQVEVHRGDGDRVIRGEVAATLAGPAAPLLTGERTALNFLQQLSGIATVTARYVDAVAGTGCRVLDTRKTLPGWRHLAKYAVRCGGGDNHRLGLYDRIMLKDNHWAAAGGDVAGVVARARRPLRGSMS